MVVCRYFQQGNCRFGQNCRFDHVFSSKYNYQAPQQQQQQQPVATTELICHQVAQYVDAAVKGGQWLLTSYAPFKDKPCIPGLVDYSPEEIRLMMYEAKSNNTVDETIARVNQLAQQATQRHLQLKETSPVIIKLLESIHRGETPQNPFDNVPNAPSFDSTNIFARNDTNNASHNVFTSNETKNQSIFSNNSNIFNNLNQSSTDINVNQNIFGGNVGSAISNPSNIFAAASEKLFGPTQTTPNINLFLNPEANVTLSNLLQPNLPQPNITQPTNPIQSNIFQTNPNQTNIFQTHIGNAQIVEKDYYSQIEELSQEEQESFKKEVFEFGFVPETPPPQAWCF